MGGVLQGQELIKQTQIRAHIRSLNEVALAVATFQSKYDAMPGDIRKPERFFPECNDSADGDGSTVYEGNGNGILEGGETKCIWLHLQNAGVYSPLGPKLGPTAPPDMLKDINFSTDAFQWAMLPGGNNIVMIISDGHGELMATHRWVAKLHLWGYDFTVDAPGALTPDILATIDQKLNDGMPATGRLVAFGTAWDDDQDCFTNPDIGSLALPQADSLYSVTNTVKSCTANYRLL